LLTDHDDERGQRSAAITRDSEEFDEANNVVASLPEDISFSPELSMDVVEVASCKSCG
jgi:hypothetical protein